jgi:hypothetical protein
VWWGFILFWQDRQEKREAQRKAAQPSVYPLIIELEAIRARFNRLGLSHPQAAKILALSAKKGGLKQELVNLNPTSFALLRDDEIAGLNKLNKELEAFNDAVRRYGTDLNYGGSTADDLLHLGHVVQRHVDEALNSLGSRYIARGQARLLEASDSPDPN